MEVIQTLRELTISKLVTYILHRIILPRIQIIKCVNFNKNLHTKIINSIKIFYQKKYLIFVLFILHSPTKIIKWL